nr:hypothetical protein Iba_chr05aCG12780 [Ipomoea batatas]
MLEREIGFLEGHRFRFGQPRSSYTNNQEEQQIFSFLEMALLKSEFTAVASVFYYCRFYITLNGEISSPRIAATVIRAVDARPASAARHPARAVPRPARAATANRPALASAASRRAPASPVQNHAPVAARRRASAARHHASAAAHHRASNVPRCRASSARYPSLGGCVAAPAPNPSAARRRSARARAPAIAAAPRSAPRVLNVRATSVDAAVFPRCPKMNCSGCTKKNCCCCCNPCYLCF